MLFSPNFSYKILVRPKSKKTGLPNIVLIPMLFVFMSQWHILKACSLAKDSFKWLFKFLFLAKVRCSVWHFYIQNIAQSEKITMS
jgi:hypothetical protein